MKACCCMNENHVALRIVCEKNVALESTVQV